MVDLGKRDQNRPSQSKPTRRGSPGPVWGAPHWSSFRRLMTTAHGIPHRNSPKPSDSRGLTPRPAVRERGRWHRQGPPTAWENGGSAVLQVGPQPRRRPPTPLLSTLSCLLSRPQAAGELFHSPGLLRQRLPWVRAQQKPGSLSGFASTPYGLCLLHPSSRPGQVR